MNFLKKNFYKIILLLIAIPNFSNAVVACDPAGGVICPPINATSINELIKQILEGVLTIAIPIIALAIVYCGFLFVQARGNPEEIKKAKQALMYTLIGSAILLGAWAIAQIISETVLAL